VLQIINKVQYVSVRLATYTLKADNKRLISQTDFSIYTNKDENSSKNVQVIWEKRSDWYLSFPCIKKAVFAFPLLSKVCSSSLLCSEDIMCYDIVSLTI